MSAIDSGNKDILPDNDSKKDKMSSKSNKSNPKSLLTNDKTSILGKDGSYFDQVVKHYQEYLTSKAEEIYDNITMSPIPNDSTHVHDASDIPVNYNINKATVHSTSK